MTERIEHRNTYLVDFLSRNAVTDDGQPIVDSAIYKKLNYDKEFFHKLKHGKNPVSPETMLHVLQTFPPRTMEEFADVGRDFLAERARIAEVRSEINTVLAQKRKRPAEPKNANFFERFYQAGVKTDQQIANILGVTRQAVHLYRKGVNSPSEETRNKADDWISRHVSRE